MFGKQYKLWSSSLCSFPTPLLFHPPWVLIFFSAVYAFKLCLSLNVGYVSHTYQTTDKIMVLYTLICMFIDKDMTKVSELHGNKHYLNWMCS
jgi:hypothetical protein